MALPGPASSTGPGDKAWRQTVRQINVGVIGAGWCGGIRANTSAENPLVNDLHIAEIDPVRLEEVSAETHAASATTD